MASPAAYDLRPAAELSCIGSSCIVTVTACFTTSMWEDAYKQPTTADVIENVEGTQPNELNNASRRRGGPRDPIDWLLVIPSIAKVYDRPAQLDVYTRAVDKSIRNWRKDHKKPHVWNYGRATYHCTFGGIYHFLKQDDHMIAIGHSIYIDLCMNLNRIQRVDIIAVESGAYMAVRLIEFIDRYGAKFEYDYGGFADEWASFLESHEFGAKLFGKHTEEICGMPTEENTISPLIRSVILVQPSLPPPSGMNKWLWYWFKPEIYDHLEWSQPSEYDTFHAKGKGRRYSIVTFERPDSSNESDTHAITMDLPNDSSFDMGIFHINDMSLAEPDLRWWLENRLRDASSA